MGTEVRKQKEKIESIVIASRRNKNGEIEVTHTLNFESGLSYRKVYIDYDEKMENLHIDDSVEASIYDGNVVNIE